jgi:predicted enzyme related to lactoylglutathione lyase
MSGDPAAASSFYSGLLGWEIEVWKPGEMDYPMIKVGEAQHGGFGPAQGGAPAHWLGHVAVEDADEAAARAEAAGGRVVAPAMDIPEVGRMVVVADPQGAILSLYTPADTNWTPAEGVFVWDELTTASRPRSASRQVVGREAATWTWVTSSTSSCRRRRPGGCMPRPEGGGRPARSLPAPTTSMRRREGEEPGSAAVSWSRPTS